MTRRISVLVISLMLALPLAIAARQPGQPTTMNAQVTITTSDERRTVAVLGKDSASGEATFLFCIDVASPAAQKIQFAGPARVVYRPLPIPGIPAGVKISGPENVSSALAVLPTQSKGWVFLAKNEKTVVSAGDSAANATLVPVTVVRRLDWVGDNGRRRGTDVEPCHIAGG